MKSYTIGWLEEGSRLTAPLDAYQLSGVTAPAFMSKIDVKVFGAKHYCSRIIMTIC